MEVYTTIADTRRQLSRARQQGRSVALVPTMGFLHEGHLELMREGRRRADVLVVSIFVNPTQFGPNEDLEAYPRDMEGDLRRCNEVGVDLVFSPSNEEVYPAAMKTSVVVSELTNGLCGQHRVGHFAGVTAVVTKLFNIVQPDVAIFGEKDYQQLAIIRQLVKDLNMPVEIIGGATVREHDGLAMSSRNAYLSAQERQEALVLNQTLRGLQSRVAAGETDAKVLTAWARGEFERVSSAKLEYLSFVDPDSLQPLETLTTATRVAVACYIGATRLIDNILIEPTSTEH